MRKPLNTPLSKEMLLYIQRNSTRALALQKLKQILNLHASNEDSIYVSYNIYFSHYSILSFLYIKITLNITHCKHHIFFYESFYLICVIYNK